MRGFGFGDRGAVGGVERVCVVLLELESLPKSVDRRLRESRPLSHLRPRRMRRSCRRRLQPGVVGAVTGEPVFGLGGDCRGRVVPLFVGGFGGAGSGQRVEGEVAASFGRFVVLFGEDGADAAADFFVQYFLGFVGPDLPQDRFRSTQAGPLGPRRGGRRVVPIAATSPALLPEATSVAIGRIRRCDSHIIQIFLDSLFLAGSNNLNFSMCG